MRVMPRVWVMARRGSCPGRSSWRWEWTFDTHEGPTYCGRRNRRRGRRDHRFRRYATRPARANPIVGAVDDHHIPDTRCQPGGRCSGRTVVAWDIPHCCATLILSMVATLCVPTESSGFVRHREDDVKPSPACDCRQRSRWCGEEHRLHQFWVTRIQPERAGKGRSRRPPVISTISGHAEARIEVPNKRLIFAAAAPSASTANHKAERFGAGRGRVVADGFVQRGHRGLIQPSAVVAGGAQPAANGVRRNTQPVGDRPVPGAVGGGQQRRPNRVGIIGRVRTRPAAVRACGRTRVRRNAPAPDAACGERRHWCAPTVAVRSHAFRNRPPQTGHTSCPAARADSATCSSATMITASGS